jgi:hypothetical protein
MIAGDRLDTIYHIATPEGCAIDLRVAGPVARARAWFLDFLVRFMIAGDRLDTIFHICAIVRVAGPVARARAWFLDFLVRS